MLSKEVKFCFYCHAYHSLFPSYPLNEAFFSLTSFTPRCELHHTFTCSVCQHPHHFNSIAWCNDCQKFTCLHCGSSHIIKDSFLFYDYYYSITCSSCHSSLSSLDFSEFQGLHPFQLGSLRPQYQDPLNVWFPLFSETLPSLPSPNSYWGSERFKSLRSFTFQRLSSNHNLSPRAIWDASAFEWVKHCPDGGDLYHKNIILPSVYSLLAPQKEDTILDLACGEGTVSRSLAGFGARVSGIDFSSLLDFAQERETQDSLGINYIKDDALNLLNHFSLSSFDKIVCNMALMNICDYQTIINLVWQILKPGGVFVFSIVHPSFSFPSSFFLKVPPDSHRNEDGIVVTDDYFDTRPILMESFRHPGQFIHFHRPLGDYLNSLSDSHFFLDRVIEPQVTEEVAEKYPTHFFRNHDRVPRFIVIKATKLDKKCLNNK